MRNCSRSFNDSLKPMIFDLSPAESSVFAAPSIGTTPPVRTCPPIFI